MRARTKSQLPFVYRGVRLELLTRPRIPEVARLIARAFARYEPIARALGIAEETLAGFIEAFAGEIVDQELSLALVDLESGRVVGGYLLHDLGVPVELPAAPPPEMAPIFAALEGILGEHLAAAPVPGPGDTTEFLMGGVAEEHHSRGLTTIAVDAVTLNSMEKGFRRELCVTTSPLSYRVMERLAEGGEARLLLEKRYADFRQGGEAIFARIADHLPSSHAWRGGKEPVYALFERDYYVADPVAPSDEVADEYRRMLAEIKGRKDKMLGKPGNMAIDFSPLADALCVLMNNSGDPLVKSSHRLGTKELERRVIEFFADLYGLDPEAGFGYVTNGGTEALEYGLLQASRSAPEALTLVSDQCHYSALTILEKYGRRYRVVPSQASGELDYDALAAIADEVPGSFIVLATLGTTMKGAYDDPGRIHAALGERLAYIHCDAALGGAFLPLLPACYGAPAVDLVAIADSISISLHKFLGNVTPAGLVLTRDPPRFSLRYIGYIASDSSTLSCSRSGIAALFAAYRLATLGKEGLRRQAIRCIALAAYLARSMEALGIPTQQNRASNIVAFAAPPAAICEKWMLPIADGMTHAVVMPHVDRAGLDEFLDDLRAAGYGAAD